MMFFARLAALLIAISLGLSACIPHPTAPVTDLSPVDKSKSSYTVRKGDTLYAIAFRTGVRYENIAAWNGIASPYNIYVGDVLALRKPSTPSAPKLPAVKPKRPAATLASAPLPTAKLPTVVSKWRWPARGTLTQKFSKARASYGIKIKANRLTPIISAASGQVVYAGDAIKGYGRLVIVKHTENFISAYAHNDQILVAEGDNVKAGQQLAKMGSTGTKGVKLHFEIRKNGRPVNPLKYLPLKRG